MIRKETYRITGLNCASCAIKAESILNNLNGVENANINFAMGTVDATFNSTITGFSFFEKALSEYGYHLLPFDSHSGSVVNIIHAKRMKMLAFKTIMAFIFSLPVFIISMFYSGRLPFEQWLLLILSLPVVFYCGWEFHTNAIRNLAKLKFDMDVLVSLSTLTAFIFSIFSSFFMNGLHIHSHPVLYFESATVIISFILLGRLLEERAKKSTSKDIELLLSKQPRQVIKWVNGQEILIAIDEIVPGDVIRLKPGEVVPVDGIINEGFGFVDESMYSGEPLPVEKAEGDKLISGTIIENGVVLMHATTTGEGSTFSKVVKLIKDAQTNKPPIQHLADRIAAVFVPAVFGIAVITFLIWIFSGVENAFDQAISAFVSVLIISCPCALGLALPTAFVAGLGKAYKHGILIKNLKTLEKSNKINSIIFDKTGTLTTGNIKVSKINWLANEYCAKYNNALHAVASLSVHPLSKAIQKFVKLDNSAKIDIIDSNYIKSYGIKAFSNSQMFLLGNRALMENHSVTIVKEISEQIVEYEKNANTVVFFAMENVLLAYVVLCDEIKPNAALLIGNLKAKGYKIVLCSGDNYISVNAVASKLGITEVYSNKTIEQKGELIMQKQKLSDIVAFVGDGINDAYAMKLADIGIAMEQGSSVAIETADIVLMRPNIDLVLTALKISRLTYKTIKQNFIWAFFYNVLAIPIAAGVLYFWTGIIFNPMIAGIAMALSSFSVVSNSLWLKIKRI